MGNQLQPISHIDVLIGCIYSTAPYSMHSYTPCEYCTTNCKYFHFHLAKLSNVQIYDEIQIYISILYQIDHHIISFAVVLIAYRILSYVGQ